MVGPVSKELTGQGSHEHPNLDIVESRESFIKMTVCGFLLRLIAKAVKIAEIKYLPSQGYHHAW